MSYSDSLDNITLDSDDILTIERFENNYFNHKNNVLQIGGVYTIEQINEKLQTIFTNILELIFRKIDFKELIFSEEFEEENQIYYIQKYFEYIYKPPYLDETKPLSDTYISEKKEYEDNYNKRLNTFKYVLTTPDEVLKQQKFQNERIFPNIYELSQKDNKYLQIVLEKDLFKVFKQKFLKDEELEYEQFFLNHFKYNFGKDFKMWKINSFPNDKRIFQKEFKNWKKNVKLSSKAKPLPPASASTIASASASASALARPLSSAPTSASASASASASVSVQSQVPVLAVSSALAPVSASVPVPAPVSASAPTPLPPVPKPLPPMPAAAPITPAPAPSPASTASTATAATASTAPKPLPPMPATATSKSFFSRIFGTNTSVPATAEKQKQKYWFWPSSGGGNNNKKLKKNIIRLYNCYILSQNQNGGANNKLSLIIKKRLDKKIIELKNLEGGANEKKYEFLLNNLKEKIKEELTKNSTEINKMFSIDLLREIFNNNKIKEIFAIDLNNILSDDILNKISTMYYKIIYNIIEKIIDEQKIPIQEVYQKELDKKKNKSNDLVGGSLVQDIQGIIGKALSPLAIIIGGAICGWEFIAKVPGMIKGLGNAGKTFIDAVKAWHIIPTVQNGRFGINWKNSHGALYY